jgi:hypothetical protein
MRKGETVTYFSLPLARRPGDEWNILFCSAGWRFASGTLSEPPFGPPLVRGDGRWLAVVPSRRDQEAVMRSRGTNRSLTVAARIAGDASPARS